VVDCLWRGWSILCLLLDEMLIGSFLLICEWLQRWHRASRFTFGSHKALAATSFNFGSSVGLSKSICTMTNKFVRPAWSCGSSMRHHPISQDSRKMRFFVFLCLQKWSWICWFSNANNFFNFQHEIEKKAMHVFKITNATRLAHKKRLLCLHNLFKMTFQNGHVCFWN